MADPNPIQEVELTKSALFAEAEKQTGCTDWGDTSVFEPALDQLLASLDTEAALHSTGRFSFWTQIAGRLSQRLLLQKEKYDQVPIEIADKPAQIIAGPPRTGTTLLQRLLGLDPDADTLRYCDVLSPVPATQPGTEEDEAKIDQMSKMLAQFYEGVPDFLKIHELDPRLPDEEVFLIDHSFMSALEPARAHVPTYWKWVMESGDLDGLYRELKHFIAYVGQYRAGSRWVLKAPHHLWMLSQLLNGFPNAQVIWTHRDPAKSVPSMCSLSRPISTMFSDSSTNEQIGSDMLEWMADGVSRAMEARKERPDDRILDVHYRDLIRDPVTTLATIYEAFEIPFPRSMPGAIQKHLTESPKGKHGSHDYTAETFGLSDDGIRERFSDYIKQYDVSTEDH
jgi:hypothetical protein